MKKWNMLAYSIQVQLFFLRLLYLMGHAVTHSIYPSLILKQVVLINKPNIRAHFNQPCPEESCWGRQEFGLSARRWRQGGCWRVWGEHHCTGLQSGPWRPASSLGKCTESIKRTQCNSYHTAFHISNLNIYANTCQIHDPQDNIACD